MMYLFSFARIYALDVQDFTFRHFGTQEGMVNQRVYAIAQTTDGAVWWTTKAGVDRTNGQGVRNYPVGNPTVYSSFAGRTVKIAHTQKNAFDTNHHRLTSIDSLYVFDNTGKIFRYNTIQDRFDEVWNIARLMKRDVILNDVLVDANGVWLAMREGVFRLQADRLVALYAGIYANYIVKTSQHLFFCTTQGVYHQKGVAVPGVNVECGYYDERYKKVWLGTQDTGIMVLDASLRRVEQHLQPSIPYNPVRSITAYDAQTMLVGVDGLGVYTSSRQHPDLPKILFDANEGNHGVLHGNGIYSLLVDCWQNIIVGSFSGGIDIARPGKALATTFQHIRNNLQTLINDHVNCVMQPFADRLFFGTDDGVSIYHSDTRQWRHLGRGLVVLDICQTTDGKLLVATYGRGVCEIGGDGTARPIYGIANGTLTDDHIVELLYDTSGNLWMGSLYGKLAVKTANGLRYFNIKNVQSMEQLPDGRVAVGTFNGVFLVSAATGKVEKFTYNTVGSDDANRYVFDLHAHNNNELWMATDGGGVYVCNLNTRQCRQITTKEGLPSNHVCSIIEDDGGHIWLGTENGLAFVTPQKGFEVVHANYNSELQKEYMRGAACRLASGNLLFGTGRGAVIVNPGQLKELDYTAQLRFVKVRCKDDESDLFQAQVQRMLTDGELWLGYTQRSFELSFEAINMRYAPDMAYQYRIGKGEWSKPMDKPTIQFENLEPGTHRMHLRCVSKMSNRTIDETTLKIIINQPWWNSWWMWCVYLLLLVLAFYGAWRVYDLHNRYMRVVVGNIKDDYAAKEIVNELNSSSTTNDSGKEFVDTATKIVLNNISDTNFTIDTLCSEMAMSRTLFYVKLKSYTGKSPQDFVRVIRLERAAALLRSGRSVTDVSTLIGFDNPKYFSTVFKKYFGVSPSKYR